LPIFLSVALASFASFGRRDLDPVFAVRSEHPMEACKIDPRFGNQRGKPSQKVKRLEDHVGGAVSIGRFQLVADPSIIQKRQAFLGYRRPSNIAA
jgi:hypothetical protein